MAAAVSDCRNRNHEYSSTTTPGNVHAKEQHRKCRYAYVSTLWGTASGFSLGALVLGQSLRRSGTRHDLVLLHTNEVPSPHLQLLSQIWMLKCVDAIDAHDMLFSSGREGSRFSGVFTKLHGLDLTEYDKILMLDIDIAVLHCADELFELPAPAALWRGMAQTIEQGYPIDGRCFFGGPNDDWGQTGGINAGVMLLRPDSNIYARALHEVQAPSHPKRISGSGPEQDYLSRFFAPYWSHLSVCYNFQLHHIFYGLEEAVRRFTRMPQTLQAGGVDAGALLTGSLDSIYWVPPRLSIDLHLIHIVHFSGECKLWDRDFPAVETDEKFVDTLLRVNCGYEARLWLDRKGDPEDYAAYGLRFAGGGGSNPWMIGSLL